MLLPILVQAIAIAIPGVVAAVHRVSALLARTAIGYAVGVAASNHCPFTLLLLPARRGSRSTCASSSNTLWLLLLLLRRVTLELLRLDSLQVRAVAAIVAVVQQTRLLLL